ncbi:MAG TPA: hypothetical protein VGS41_03395 [Chthonomonadales bacterium]|nr:hypothetical protein [Chthonomonadales bacterium]
MHRSQSCIPAIALLIGGAALTFLQGASASKPLRPTETAYGRPTESLSRSGIDAERLLFYRALARGKVGLIGGSKAASQGEVIPTGAELTTAIGNLQQTRATSYVVPVAGQPFAQALRVTIGADSQETNATQLTIPITAPVRKGDVLLATFRLRGAAAASQGKPPGPARVMFLFERAVDPWTKSVAQTVSASRDPSAWTSYSIPFAAVESYQPGEAMVSVRFAFGPQSLYLGGLNVVNYGSSLSLQSLVARAAAATPVGRVSLAVRPDRSGAKLVGFGGNFCQPRYGSSQPLDAVGAYVLDHLKVVHARVGIPLNVWAPAPGVYRDEGPAHAALLLMQVLFRRHIPIVGTVWEGPVWMLGGKPEQMGRVLPPSQYSACINAIGSFLTTARDKYGVSVDCFSFNEADYGVNFKFTPQTIDDFVKQAGPRFAALGLKTRFLVGDTGGGASLVAYTKTLLQDKTVARYLGPIAFHCWDVLDVSGARYREIAALGRAYSKPIWCTEAGHDAALWHKPNPWPGWENALRTALAYCRTLRLSGARLMDYWTYEDNYPIVSPDGKTAYPVFYVIQAMERALPTGARMAHLSTSHPDIEAAAATGPGRNRVSLLIVNMQGRGAATITGLPPGADAQATILAENASRSAAEASSGYAQKVLARRVDRAGNLTIPIPTRSVITAIIGAPLHSASASGG